MKSPPADVTTIDQYVNGFPDDVRRILNELRATIRAAAPEASEKISYRMPTYYYNGNLVHFAAYQHHIGFYPTPSGIDAFEDELGKYKRAKGSVQFPIDEPLPLDLIARIVKHRVRENGSRKGSGRKKAT
jgi:uncharacterized protein YdhG (YjbR/CyaY superfamily)